MQDLAHFEYGGHLAVQDPGNKAIPYVETDFSYENNLVRKHNIVANATASAWILR